MPVTQSASVQSTDESKFTLTQMTRSRKEEKLCTVNSVTVDGSRHADGERERERGRKASTTVAAATTTVGPTIEFEYQMASIASKRGKRKKRERERERERCIPVEIEAPNSQWADGLTPLARSN